MKRQHRWVLNLSILVILYSPLYAIAKDNIVATRGMPVYPFTITQLNGDSFVLDQKKSTIIWFFAPWCEYMGEVYSFMSKDCSKAISELNHAYFIYGDQFDWIGISTHLGSTATEVSEYRAKHNIPFAIAIDSAGDIFSRFAVSYSPTVIIIYKNKIYYRAKASLQQLDETIKSLSSLIEK